MNESFRHGTYKGYGRMGCRCDRCRAYQIERVARSRADRLANGRVKHGNSGWDDGCRCETCATAKRERYYAYYYRNRG